MEPQETSLDKSRGGRPANVTAEQLAQRARQVRSLLVAGKGPAEIRLELNLTAREYQTAVRWISRRWQNNDQAYAEYLVSESGRVEFLQEQIKAVLGDESVPVTRKAYAIGYLVRLSNHIETQIREMGIKLGILEGKLADGRDGSTFNDNRMVIMVNGKPARDLPVGLLSGATVDVASDGAGS